MVASKLRLLQSLDDIAHLSRLSDSTVVYDQNLDVFATLKFVLVIWS